ncbi:MAG TPA: SPOR domain-containing protein [Anaeromyxobacter sp.]|nr:SPOR domain-containing protein [Anaeromyxobacter sp.]
MAHANVRTEERFQVSLGGVQIASIVLGSLLLLAVVFFLGLEVGQRVGVRRAEAARPASLGDLDAAAVSARPPTSKDLTFPAELPRAKPPPPPPARSPATAEPASPPPPATRPAPAPAPTPAPEPTPAAGEAASAALAPPGGWTVQLGASQRREEAEGLARKVQGLGPRIEEADLAGKGHFFRVRVGRFESKGQAEKYRNDVARETGIAGMVVSPGG